MDIMGAASPARAVGGPFEGRPGCASLETARAVGGPFEVRPGCASLEPDRKSTRLNSSHSQISYAVFCLKKKKTPWPRTRVRRVPRGGRHEATHRRVEKLYGACS